MKIHPILTLEMITFEIRLRKALKKPLELFFLHRGTEDRVGYSIAYMDDLNGSSDILCTSYIWTDRKKALKKLFELVQFEESVKVKVG